jgi:hypothetical protein
MRLCVLKQYQGLGASTQRMGAPLPEFHGTKNLPPSIFTQVKAPTSYLAPSYCSMRSMHLVLVGRFEDILQLAMPSVRLSSSLLSLYTSPISDRG